MAEDTNKYKIRKRYNTKSEIGIPAKVLIYSLESLNHIFLRPSNRFLSVTLQFSVITVITAQRWLVDDGMFGMMEGAKQVICVSGIYDYVLRGMYELSLRDNL